MHIVPRSNPFSRSTCSLNVTGSPTTKGTSPGRSAHSRSWRCKNSNLRPGRFGSAASVPAGKVSFAKHHAICCRCSAANRRARCLLISVRTSLFGTMTRVRACSLPRRTFSPVHVPQHCLFGLPSCFCFERISPNHPEPCPAFITFWQNSSSVSAFPLALLAFHLLACFPCHSISPHGAPLRR